MMDSNTGHLYPSIKDALAAGVPRSDLVEISGDPEAVQKVAKAVAAKARNRARNKAARKSRKRNR